MRKDLTSIFIEQCESLSKAQFFVSKLSHGIHASLVSVWLMQMRDCSTTCAEVINTLYHNPNFLF